MPGSQQNRKSFLAAFHLAGQSIVLNAISVPVIAYTIHRLREDGFGQWSTATELVAAVTILTNLGLRGTFVRSVARDSQNAGQDLAEQLGVRMLLCFLAAAVVMTVCLLLGYPKVVIQCAAVSSIGIFFVTFASTLSDLLQGVHRISIYAAANFIAGAILTAVSAIVVWLWPGPVTLSVAYLIGPAVTVVMLLHYVHTRMFPVRIAWTPVRWFYLLKNSRHMALQQFVNTLSLKVEALILPKLVGPALFGLFSAGSLLVNRLAVISDGLGSAFYPVIAQSLARDAKVASREVGKFLLMALAVCLPVTIGVMFVSGPVAHILFSKHAGISNNADICQRVICITIWALPLMGIESMMGYALNAAGKEGSLTRYASYAISISLPLAVVLVMCFGITGACWSLVSRIAIRIIFIAYPFMTTFAPPIPVVRFAKVAACGTAMAIAMWCMGYFVPDMSVVEESVGKLRHWSMMLTMLGVEGLVGIVVYAATLFVLRIVSADDLNYFLKRKKSPEAVAQAAEVRDIPIEQEDKIPAVVLSAISGLSQLSRTAADRVRRLPIAAGLGAVPRRKMQGRQWWATIGNRRGFHFHFFVTVGRYENKKAEVFGKDAEVIPEPALAADTERPVLVGTETAVGDKSLIDPNQPWGIEAGIKVFEKSECVAQCVAGASSSDTEESPLSEESGEPVLSS